MATNTMNSIENIRTALKTLGYNDIYSFEAGESLKNAYYDEERVLRIDDKLLREYSIKKIQYYHTMNLEGYVKNINDRNTTIMLSSKLKRSVHIKEKRAIFCHELAHVKLERKFYKLQSRIRLDTRTLEWLCNYLGYSYLLTEQALFESRNKHEDEGVYKLQNKLSKTYIIPDYKVLSYLIHYKMLVNSIVIIFGRVNIWNKTKWIALWHCRPHIGTESLYIPLKNSKNREGGIDRQSVKGILSEMLDDKTNMKLSVDDIDEYGTLKSWLKNIGAKYINVRVNDWRNSIHIPKISATAAPVRLMEIDLK